MTDLVPNATAADESQEQPLYLAAVGVLCAVISAFVDSLSATLLMSDARDAAVSPMSSA